MESKFQEDWCCWCLDPKTEASHKHKLLPSAGRTVVVTQRFSLMKFASAVEDVLPGWGCTSSLSHGTPPPFLGGLQIAKDRRWIPCAYTHSLNHSTAHPGAANGIKTQETNNLNHFVIGFVFFFYYQGKFSVVHALHYFPSCISGGVTPATQVKAQWPIRRHHRVSWRVNVTWTRTVKKKQKSNMDRPLLSDSLTETEYNQQTYQSPGGTGVQHFEGQDPGKHTGPGFLQELPRWVRELAAVSPLKKHSSQDNLGPIARRKLSWHITADFIMCNCWIAILCLRLSINRYQLHCCWEGKRHVPSHRLPGRCRMDGSHKD